MIITRKHLPRRTFLRGLGTAIALPMLDAMAPALARPRRTAGKAARRLAFAYIPNGAIMQHWTPKGRQQISSSPASSNRSSPSARTCWCFPGLPITTATRWAMAAATTPAPRPAS